MPFKPAAAYHAVLWPLPHQSIPDYGHTDVMGVACDPRRGTVFVVQRSLAYPVLVFDPSGRFLRSWGGGQFTAPHNCRVDAGGNVWITDNGDHRVLKFTPDGKPLAAWGMRGVAGKDARHFNRPADVAFAPNGSAYVADGYGNSRVVQINLSGEPNRPFVRFWGRRGTQTGEFHLVHSVVVDTAGRVFVADRENARLQIFTPEGRFITAWKNVGKPFGLGWTPHGNLVVCDGVANTISIYDPATAKRLARWGSTGSGPGQFRRAHNVGVDKTTGAIYTAEVKGRRVQKFVSKGNL